MTTETKTQLVESLVRDSFDRDALIADLVSLSRDLFLESVQSEDDEDDVFCDVRLRWHDDEWYLKTGPSDYDLDHRGYWGCSSVSPNIADDEASSIADDLLDQVLEHMASDPSVDYLNDDDVNDIFCEYFKGVEEWSLDYHENHGDYADGLSYIMGEGYRINDSVRELLSDWSEDLGIPWGSVDAFQALTDDLAADIYQGGYFDICDSFYEYSSGPDGLLDSFPIGEIEEQIELSRIVEDLGDKLPEDEIEALLDNWASSQRDFCLNTDDINLEKPRQYPCVYQSILSDQCIGWVVDQDTMRERLAEVVIADCRRRDFRSTK